MPSIAGAQRGNLLKIKPQNLVIDWAKNFSRPEGAKDAQHDPAELVPSILAGGVREAVTVRSLREGGGKAGKVMLSNEGEQLFEVIKGFRRSTAAKMAQEQHGWDGLVPCMLWEGDEEQALVDNLVENDQRADITPLGRAAVYKALADKHGWSAERIHKETGRAEDFVRDHLKLVTTAHPAVREALATQDITWAAARMAMRVTREQQPEVVELLKGRTAIEARSIVNRIVAGTPVADALGALPPPVAPVDADEPDTDEGTTGDAPKAKKPTVVALGFTKAQAVVYLDQRIDTLAKKKDKLSERQLGKLDAYRELLKKLNGGATDEE